MAEAPRGEDPLAGLRASVAEARRAAERLAAQVAAGDPPPARPPRGTRASALETPAAGWDSDHERRETTGEIQALGELVESLRALLPEELREQLNELIRQVLLLLRAVIDWLVARIEREGKGREVEIQDIPIS